jgi:hypothetical protein
MSIVRFIISPGIILHEIQKNYSGNGFLYGLIAWDAVGFMLWNDVKQYNEQMFCFCEPANSIIDAG